MVRTIARITKVLAALLLISTLARSYVQFPLTLIEELNRIYRSKPPFDQFRRLRQYNDTGLRLFKVRHGSAAPEDPTRPSRYDCAFSFSHCTAKYSTWGENEEMCRYSIVNCGICEIEYIGNSIQNRIQDPYWQMSIVLICVSLKMMSYGSLWNYSAQPKITNGHALMSQSWPIVGLPTPTRISGSQTFREPIGQVLTQSSRISKDTPLLVGDIPKS